MITIICVGKLKEKYLSDLVNDYYGRINKYHKLNIVELKDSNKKDEGILIEKNIKDGNYLVTLEINSNNISSLELSKNIDKWLMEYGNITFVIGGSDGLDESIIKKANYHLSFGNNTYPHGLFRGILLEQIYRSFKIINNETYHK